MTEKSITEQTWDKTSEKRKLDGGHKGWLDHPYIIENTLQKKTSGDIHKNWLIGICDKLSIPKNLQWLSLGCGSGGQEIYGATQGIFSFMKAIDFSSNSLNIAKTDADNKGITCIEFEKQDLNTIELSEEKYDIVLMNMSLHHIKELPRLLEEIKKTLRPNGKFIIHEFVGARQFQFSDEQLRIVNVLLKLLPEKYRIDSTTGTLKTEYNRRSIDWWNHADPSEAICSDIIEQEVEKRFNFVDRVDYGGGILMLLLEHIVHNFNEEIYEDKEWLRILTEIEILFQKSNIIKNDFTILTVSKTEQ